MNTKKWMAENTASLAGKTVAITGSTGGLGSAVCRYVLTLGGRLILVARSHEKAETLRRELLAEFREAEVSCLYGDLTDMASVKALCGQLSSLPLDILILNAGGYCLERTPCGTGFDPVYQTNFVGQYYMARTLLPVLCSRHGRIVATGSIAYSGSVTDPGDIDFHTRTNNELIYGNSKRYLMFSLFELIRKNPGVQLSVAHPGITYTNITSHYPKAKLRLIKWPMKLTFMHPPKACRGIVKGMFADIPDQSWIGPKYFDIWGDPVISSLKTLTQEERDRIYQTAEEIYSRLNEGSAAESTAACDPAVRT